MILVCTAIGNQAKKKPFFFKFLQYVSAWSLLSTNNVLASILILSHIIPEECSWRHMN